MRRTPAATIPFIGIALALACEAAAGGWEIHAAAVGPLTVPRARHQVAPLADGRVLVCGGIQVRVLPLPGVFVLDSAEVFLPANGQWHTLPSPMTARRWDHVAITLDDGRVLIAGGRSDFRNKTGTPIATTELFDPRTDRFTVGPTMDRPRAMLTATRIDDGRVLLAGGSTAQVFDPRTNRFAATIDLRVPREAHAAVALPQGRVLLLGGDGRRAGAAVELVDCRTGVSRLLAARLDPPADDLGAELLPDGAVLAILGQHPDGHTLRTCQRIDLDGDGAGASEARPFAAELDRRSGLADMACVPFGPLVLIAGGEADLGTEDIIADQAWLLDTRSGQYVAQAAMCRPHDDFAWCSLGPDMFGWERVLLVAGLGPDREWGEVPQAGCEILTLVPTASPLPATTIARSGIGVLRR